MKRLALMLAFAGCGRSSAPDECQTFVDKSAPVLRELAAGSGSDSAARPVDLDALRAQCRKDREHDPGRVDCVLAAANADAVAVCWAGAALP